MRIPETEPLVSDSLLVDLANPDFAAQCGDFDSQSCAMLAVALPEMARELLRWRRTAQGRRPALCLALQWEAIDARLKDARRTIRSPGPISAPDLTAACETLLRHSTDAAERAAASDVLAQMQEAA